MKQEAKVHGFSSTLIGKTHKDIMLLTAESCSGQARTVSARASISTPISNGEEDSSVTVVPLHPLGIKPAGNAYTSSSNIRSTIGMFNSLPDELIVQVLEHLHSTSLLQLGATCKALYAFSRLEDLWKALFIGYAGSPLSCFDQSVFSLDLCFGCVDHHCRVGACCSTTVAFSPVLDY